MPLASITNLIRSLSSLRAIPPFLIFIKTLDIKKVKKKLSDLRKWVDF